MEETLILTCTCIWPVANKDKIAFSHGSKNTCFFNILNRLKAHAHLSPSESNTYIHTYIHTMLETQLLLSHYYHAKMRKTTVNGLMNLQGPITSLIGRFYQKPRWIGPTCWLCTLGVHGLPPEAQHGSLEHKVFDQPVIVDSNWTILSSVYKTLCVHFSNKKFDLSI